MNVLLLVAMFLVAQPQAAQVVRVPATVHRSLFDPKEPQPYIPKMKDRENAVTQARFEARCAFTHEVVSRTQGEVTIRLINTRITLSLDSVIYLPTDVRPPLRVHEEGHRVINERIYENEAESIAREVVSHVLEKSWTAASAERAVAAAMDEFVAQYRLQLARRATAVNERFDQITRHAANVDVTVVDAIDQAFASTMTTAPTTTTTIPTTTQAATARTPPPAPRAGP